MRAKAKFIDPEKMEASITITMPLKDWREVMRQMPSGWPSWEVAQLIASVLGEVNRVFTADIKDIKP